MKRKKKRVKETKKKIGNLRDPDVRARSHKRNTREAEQWHDCGGKPDRFKSFTFMKNTKREI